MSNSLTGGFGAWGLGVRNLVQDGSGVEDYYHYLS